MVSRRLAGAAFLIFANPSPWSTDALIVAPAEADRGRHYGLNYNGCRHGCGWNYSATRMASTHLAPIDTLIGIGVGITAAWIGGISNYRK
jgi:hypothetical protein